MNDLENGTIMDENSQEFQLSNVMANGVVEALAEKDESGDYPILQFSFVGTDGVPVRFALKRDELAAISFALARQDQQSKLLSLRLKEYKEVPVRLTILAQKDIKKGDYVVCWRKERVPQEYNYTKL
mgnify:CR=1 FL=1